MKKLHGQALLHRFDEQVSRCRQDIDGLERQIASAEKAISAANKQREEAYSALAGFYCDEHDRLKHELVAVSRELQLQFDAKSIRRAEVKADIARWDELIEQSLAELRQARAARDVAAAERDAANARVQTELGRDAQFQTESTACAAAQQQLQREIATCATLKMEVKMKLTVYQKNPFFMYLVNRSYGTTHYKAMRLIRRGDDWLAKRVAWSHNYAQYMILTALPSQGESRVGEATRLHQSIAARLALRIQEAEQSKGATEAKQRLDRRCHTVSEIESRIAQQGAQRETLLREGTALETNQDPFIQKAKQAIKNMLAGESLQALKARAQRTQAGRDLVLVSAIEQSEAAVNEGRRAVKRLRQEQHESEGRRKRAEIARRKFSCDYTDTYDFFDADVDVDNLLVAYLAGNAPEHQFWSEIKQHHRDETPAPSHFSSSSDSSFGGGDFGGGSSSGGGDFSSSGGGGDPGGSSFGGGD